MADGRLLLEYSKSAKAACPLCGSTISKGVVRIGRVALASGWQQTKWHHPTCFAEHHPAADFAKMSGFLSLAATDQKAMRDIKASSEAKTENTPEATTVGLVTGLTTAVLDGFHPSKLSNSYKDVRLPDGWKAFSTVILNETKDIKHSDKIAAFDFDGTLADTKVNRIGAEAWSILFKSIPEKLAFYHAQSYKVVIFTNEANIDRFTKARAKAIDSKLGRLKRFMQIVNVPLQVFIACGKSGCNDPFRKPAIGMWQLLESHFNGAVSIDKERSFYVGDAAGRTTDHSDADIAFSQAVGLKFLVPEEIFSPQVTATAEISVSKVATVQVEKVTIKEDATQSAWHEEKPKEHSSVSREVRVKETTRESPEGTP